VKIIDIISYEGKNIYSHKPVIKMILDIGKYEEIPSNEIEGFNEALLSLFPGFALHKCCKGYVGGFKERLEEGTYMPHITEHLCIELQNIAGYDVSFGKARLAEKPSIYSVIYEFQNERFAIECGRIAIEILKCILKKDYEKIGTMVDNLKKTAIECELGPSTKAIYDEAIRRGIPVRRIGTESLLQLGYGKYMRHIAASMTDKTSCISADIAGNKQLTKKILEDHDIPVAQGDIAYTFESCLAATRYMGFPVVVKPFDGCKGKGVTIGINNEEELRKAYEEAVKFSKAVIVEKLVEGNDYRILVVGDKVSAAAERKPASVVGDGIHTVEQLVSIENNNPLRGDDHEKPLTKIIIDDIAKNVLISAGKSLDYIPEKGEIVALRNNSNLSTGGTARDCTNEVHPLNKEIAVKAAKALGLDIAGIDIKMKDITKPLSKNNGAIIEVNAAPGLRMHLYPSEGKSRNVASDIIDMIYPKGEPYTIPIVSITGTNGKTTTTRMVSHILSMWGKTVGMTSTSGIYVAGKCIQKGDNTGPVSARMVLGNPAVDAAVLETARGGIIKKGLGYDMADVGVIVNISEDHLGIDGIETIEELAFTKALVIEAVKPDGYAVLNADDRMTEYFLNRTASKVILFSKNLKNKLLQKHMNEGGKAVYADSGKISIFDGKKAYALVEIKDIPITFGGMLECNIENSLAAISASIGLAVPEHVIKAGAKSFKPDIENNPGRFNIFNMGNFKVMLDYGHNSAGYDCVMKFIKQIEANRLVGIIGMPGDRQDKYIIEAGKLCAETFSYIYIKEDNDLRGREPGEVAGIFYDAIIKQGFPPNNLQIIYSELKALEVALTEAKPGDLIVMFYEEFEPVLELLEKFKKQLIPVEGRNEEVIKVVG